MISAKRNFGLGVIGSFCLFIGCAHGPKAGKEAGMTPPEHMSVADTYLMLGDQTLAIKQYEAAIRQDKNYVPALVALGNHAYKEKDFKLAREYFKRAHKAAPQEAVIISNMAMAYLADGEDAQELESILKAALPNAGVIAPYIWDTLANIWMKQERFKDAELAIERAARDAPMADASFQENLELTQEKFASLQPKASL